MATSGIDRHLAPIGGRAIRMRTPGARPRHPAGFSVSARPDLTSFACSAQSAERNGRSPGRHRSGWTFALCRFLKGALLGRLRIPVSIALLTLGIFVFAHAETINHIF